MFSKIKSTLILLSKMSLFIIISSSCFAFNTVIVNGSENRKVTIHIANKTLNVELAQTSEQKRKGLMFRKYLEENSGMLFIFRKPYMLSFWMKNTLIPLDVAFLDKTGKIINIKSMKPLDKKIHSSGTFAKYALEVNHGWFTKNGIKRDDIVNIPSL